MYWFFFLIFVAILKHLFMYLIASDSKMVVSVAFQILRARKVTAHVYFDAKPRSYEDCVRYGSPFDFPSLSDLIDYYVNSYGKVTISATC